MRACAGLCVSVAGPPDLHLAVSQAVTSLDQRSGQRVPGTKVGKVKVSAPRKELVTRRGAQPWGWKQVGSIGVPRTHRELLGPPVPPVPCGTIRGSSKGLPLACHFL